MVTIVILVSVAHCQWVEWLAMFSGLWGLRMWEPRDVTGVTERSRKEGSASASNRKALTDEA